MGKALGISGSGGSGPAVAPASLRQLYLPGTLAAGTNLAPLTFYTMSVNLTLWQVALKQAPVGGATLFSIYAGLTLLCVVSVAAGATTGSATCSAAVPAGTLITVNVAGSVGSTYLGSDATLVGS